MPGMQGGMSDGPLVASAEEPPGGTSPPRGGITADAGSEGVTYNGGDGVTGVGAWAVDAPGLTSPNRGMPPLATGRQCSSWAWLSV